MERLGATPMRAELASIRAMKTPGDFARLAGQAQTTLLGSLFDMSIGPDSKDPTQYAITIGQSGLGLPDRDYYLTKDFAAQKEKYRQYAQAALGSVGCRMRRARRGRVMAFETAIAQASWSRAESRDDDKTYNPMKPETLDHAAAGFDWRAFLQGAELGSPAQVVLEQNTAIAAIAGAGRAHRHADAAWTGRRCTW